MKKSLIAVVMAVSIATGACSSTTILKSLEMAVDAAAIALPIVALTSGIPPVLIVQLEGYLQSVNVALDQAIVILSGPGTTQEKSTAIVVAFAAVAVPALPAGTPKIVSDIIQEVAADVARFLQNIATPKTIARIEISKTPRNIGIRDADGMARLAKIREKVRVNLAAIRE